MRKQLQLLHQVGQDGVASLIVHQTLAAVHTHVISVTSPMQRKAFHNECDQGFIRKLLRKLFSAGRGSGRRMAPFPAQRVI